MGTSHIRMRSGRPRHRRGSFKRIFIGYCAGMLGVTIALTCIGEVVLFILFTLLAKSRGFITYDPTLEPLRVWLAIAIPFVVLVFVIGFFAWLMGRKISQPVAELLWAVEKIRQRDLDFTITYTASNELGDLCAAFNKLRAELQESLEREWRQQEEMQTLVAALSHDLRTPVTIIQGHIEGLTRTEPGEKRQQRLERYLPVLEASSQRMTRLLNDMLLVSTLEQTSFIIQAQMVSLEPALAHKAHMYTLQATASHVTFLYNLHNPTANTSPICLDLHRLEQVLDNLFENALRYTPANGQISLICTRETHTLHFIMHDTGCGISPADLPHIWQKFYHGQSSSNKTSPKTTGLGLYTCKLLIERHGGTITLRNHPAGGCEVTFSLPLTPT